MSPAAEASEIQPGTITVIARGEQNAASGVTKIYADPVEHALRQTRFVPPPNTDHRPDLDDDRLDRPGPCNRYYIELRIPYRDTLCFKASCKLGASCLPKWQ
jgi:hypothetical protein